MQSKLTSFSDLIAQWPSLVVFHEDLGVPYPTAAAMKQRGSIGSEHWARVVEAASKRGIEGVTVEMLAKFAEKRRVQPRKRGAA